MPSASATSERERLAELEVAVAAADRRARDLDAECRKARRSHERAVGPMRDYWREIGGGAERDPDREAELEAGVRAADSALTARPIITDGRVTDFVAVDEALEAQLDGAREAHEAAVAERDRFLAANGAALVAEALPEAREALAACRAALGAYAEAAAAYEARVRELIRYGAPADEFPEAPAVDAQEAAAFRNAARRGLFAEGAGS
jgi:hypothetical protein